MEQLGIQSYRKEKKIKTNIEITIAPNYQSGFKFPNPPN